MVTTVSSHERHPRILLLEPNTGLRRAIVDVLGAAEYDVDLCDSLDQVVGRARGEHRVALVAWQSMEGLLADGQREVLRQLTDRLRIVLMVPRRWLRLLDQSQYGFVGMIAKPFDADELLQSMRDALDAERPIAQPAD
jgi:DNA-binding NtrC family response regulator